MHTYSHVCLRFMFVFSSFNFTLLILRSYDFNAFSLTYILVHDLVLTLDHLVPLIICIPFLYYFHVNTYFRP